MSLQARSIHTKQPSNSGGTEAAQGYLFQHHVCVSVLLDMLSQGEYQTVYVETHDDITAIKLDGNGELIQVKTTDKDQLWTLAMLTEQSTGKDGKKKPDSSMLHTSLSGDDFDETVIFRIFLHLSPFTSYTVFRIGSKSLFRIWELFIEHPQEIGFLLF